MSRISSGLETRAMLGSLGRLIIAGLAMTGVCVLANHYVFHHLATMSTLARVAWLAVVVPAAGAVYFTVAKLLHVEEAGDFIEILERRFRKRLP